MSSRGTRRPRFDASPGGYRIRLRHRALVTSIVDFSVPAGTPEEAARIVADAYRIALASDSPVISLPSGECVLLEPHEVTFLDLDFVAVNDAGDESDPITPRNPKPH